MGAKDKSRSKQVRLAARAAKYLFIKIPQIPMIRQKNRRPPAGGVLQAGGIIACGSYNHSKRPG